MTDRAPTEDEAKKFGQWYGSGAPPKSAATPDADPPSGDMPWYSQVGRGLARGVAGDIPGLSSSKFATQDDAGYVEQGARYVGEYGPMFVPGLDFGLGAKFGTKAAEWALEHGPELQSLAKVLGPSRAQAMVEKLWSAAPKAGTTLAQGGIGGVMADPEHPVKGALTGALTAGGVGMVPKAVKKYATGAASAGTGLLGYEAIKGRGNEGLPAYFAAQHILSPLALTAAAAALHKPTLAGAAGAGARKWWESDEDADKQ